MSMFDMTDKNKNLLLLLNEILLEDIERARNCKKEEKEKIINRARKLICNGYENTEYWCIGCDLQDKCLWQEGREDYCLEQLKKTLNH